MCGRVYLHWCQCGSRRTICGVSSLLPPCSPLELNSSHLAWQQAPLPAEPSCWPLFVNRVSCILSWPWTHYVAKDDSELLIPLCQHPRVLEIQVRTVAHSLVLGTESGFHACQASQHSISWVAEFQGFRLCSMNRTCSLNIITSKYNKMFNFKT